MQMLFFLRTLYVAFAVRVSHQNNAGRLEEYKEESEQDVLSTFTRPEREEIARMSEMPDLYNKMVQSIGPTIFGRIISF